jgi:hypothetical protein
MLLMLFGGIIAIYFDNRRQIIHTFVDQMYIFVFKQVVLGPIETTVPSKDKSSIVTK